METQKRRDLIISGFMGGQGGVYKSVTIHGQGKVHGDLDCIDFLCNGRTKIQGGMKAESAEIHGFAHIDESCDSNKLIIHGNTTVGGNLTGEEIDINGFLDVKGNCAAESFHSKGGFRIHGLLNADTIDIHLHARCEAKEIGGGSIRIQKPGLASRFHKLIQSIFPSFDVLSTEIIEGDDIHLENTRAKVVRGTNVTIGQGCEIGFVEYKQHFHRDETAKITESRPV